jgi:hypothetical protein
MNMVTQFHMGCQKQQNMSGTENRYLSQDICKKTCFGYVQLHEGQQLAQKISLGSHTDSDMAIQSDSDRGAHLYGCMCPAVCTINY